MSESRQLRPAPQGRWGSFDMDDSTDALGDGKRRVSSTRPRRDPDGDALWVLAAPAILGVGAVIVTVWLLITFLRRRKDDSDSSGGAAANQSRHHILRLLEPGTTTYTTQEAYEAGMAKARAALAALSSVTAPYTYAPVTDADMVWMSRAATGGPSVAGNVWFTPGACVPGTVAYGANGRTKGYSMPPSKGGMPFVDTSYHSDAQGLGLMLHAPLATARALTTALSAQGWTAQIFASSSMPYSPALAAQACVPQASGETLNAYLVGAIPLGAGTSGVTKCAAPRVAARLLSVLQNAVSPGHLHGGYATGADMMWFSKFGTMPPSMGANMFPMWFNMHPDGCHTGEGVHVTRGSPGQEPGLPVTPGSDGRPTIDTGSTDKVPSAGMVIIATPDDAARAFKTAEGKGWTLQSYAATAFYSSLFAGQRCIASGQ